MKKGEVVDFIAERPHIFDNDLRMPWPDDEVFRAMALDSLSDVDLGEEGNDWILPNTISNKRDGYFRMRYRGATYPWNDFFPEEPLSEEQTVRLEQFLQHGIWAPAVDSALALYEETEDKRYKTAAIFACGLHVYDILDHSWSFIDPKLKDNSGVREKHFGTFLYRVDDVSRLDMSEDEQAYFDTARAQLHLAFAEIAAQSPVSSSRTLSFIDRAIGETGEHIFYDKARSYLFDLSYLSEAMKIRVVARFQQSAREARFSEYSTPYFPLGVLHLAGLATVGDFYDEDDLDDAELQWWTLSPEEVLAGDSSRLRKAGTETLSSFDQGELF